MLAKWVEDARHALERDLGAWVSSTVPLVGAEGSSGAVVMELDRGDKCIAKLVQARGRRHLLDMLRCDRRPYLPEVVGVYDFDGDRVVLVVRWLEGATSEHPYDAKAAARMVRRLHRDYPLRGSHLDIKREIIRAAYDGLVDSKVAAQLFGYVSRHARLLAARPTSLVHGDLHRGNVLMTSEGAKLIDIDDIMVGDPYIDLIYASNIFRHADEHLWGYLFIEEYFSHAIPDDFWPTVNCYAIWKLLLIMHSQAKARQPGSPVADIRSMIDEHRGLEDDEPHWFSRLREGVRVGCTLQAGSKTE